MRPACRGRGCRGPCCRRRSGPRGRPGGGHCSGSGAAGAGTVGQRVQRGGVQVTSFRAWGLPPEACGARGTECERAVVVGSLRGSSSSTGPCRLIGVRAIRTLYPHHQPVGSESSNMGSFPDSRPSDTDQILHPQYRLCDPDRSRDHDGSCITGHDSRIRLLEARHVFHAGDGRPDSSSRLFRCGSRAESRSESPKPGAVTRERRTLPHSRQTKPSCRSRPRRPRSAQGNRTRLRPRSYKAGCTIEYPPREHIETECR